MLHNTTIVSKYSEPSIDSFLELKCVLKLVIKIKKIIHQKLIYPLNKNHPKFLLIFLKIKLFSEIDLDLWFLRYRFFARIPILAVVELCGVFPRSYRNGSYVMRNDIL